MLKLEYIGLCVLVTSLLGCTGSGRTDRNEIQQKNVRPNIIYVMADQMRYDMAGYAGNYQAHTPNLDRLAAEGMNFKNCVSVSPVCAPHRASLITGKYTSSTGMVVNELRLNPNQTTIAHVLNRNGYETGYIGKWHLWGNNPGKHGGAENNFVPPGPYRMGFDGLWKAYNFHHDNFNSVYYSDSPQPKKYEKAYEPEAQFDMAIDFIRQQKSSEKPFALFLNVGIPHDPWTKENVPKKYYDLYKDVNFGLPKNWSDTPDPYMDRNTDPEAWLKNWKANMPEMVKVYHAMVASLDDNMGRLLSAMEEAGVSENTILVFSSDHGEMFGENGRVFKMTFYESAARIPFLIRWPQHIPAGVQSDALLNTPDVMPTLLGLLKLPAPSSVEGMDLSHLCLGQPGEEPAFAFLQGMGHTYLWNEGFEWRAVRDKRFTYAKYLRDGSEVLFDNQKDPLQTHNLVSDPLYKDVYQEMKDKMKLKMNDLQDEFKPSTWYRDHWIDENRNIIASAKGVFTKN